MERPRRTKLVCTIGPASVGRLPELVAAGLDVARINFSHGAPAEHRSAAESVRAAAEQAGRPVALMNDLAGPKIRLGELADGEVELEAGSAFALRLGSDSRPGDVTGAPVSYPRLAADVRAGDRILLADGAAELRVTATGDEVMTEVVRGGTVRSRAGVAVPADRVSAPALTEKDIGDVPRTLKLGADYVAQSFVRRAADIRELRERLDRAGAARPAGPARLAGPAGVARPAVVAKIETRPAVDAFDEILEVADAVMIARGDLGVELPYEEVPVIQKQLVRRALDRGVPSIVATQMLESMTASPRPTRAEASDVANAVFDGADAIMLSAETAIGAYPIEAARAAAAIARACEERGAGLLPPGAPRPVGGDAAALAYAAVALTAADPAIAGIACYTRTGRTARLVASMRPAVPVFAFAPDPSVVRRLALVRGVVPRPSEPTPAAEHRLGVMAGLLARDPLLPGGATVVLVASSAPPGSGPNLLEVHRLPEEGGSATG